MLPSCSIVRSTTIIRKRLNFAGFALFCPNGRKPQSFQLLPKFASHKLAEGRAVHDPVYIQHPMKIANCNTCVEIDTSSRRKQVVFRCCTEILRMRAPADGSAIGHVTEETKT